MDQNMTLEKRIAAELYSYQGKMSVFVDDLQGHTVEMGADEEFETASTIKAYILAVLYLQASRGKASLTEEIEYRPEHFVDGSGMLRALGVGAKLKVKDTATMMIICSDNIATNMIIDYLGLETAAQFCGHWAYRRTQYVQPCAADIQSSLHRAQSAAADFGCCTRHLAADTEDGRTHFGLADGLPCIGQPISNDRLSCTEEIFHSTGHTSKVKTVRSCNSGKNLSRNTAGLGDKSSNRIAASEPHQSIFQAAQRLPDIGNIPTGAGVFQHAQQATVRASFQHIIYKTGVSFLGSASQALEIFQCCPDADTSAVQRLPNFSKARCGLLRSGTGHLNAVLCIFSKHSGIRFYKGCATNCPLDQACGCQCAHQISDSDASECSAWGTARFSTDCNVPDGVQQRGSCTINRRCKAHSSERRDYGSNGPCHFRPMLFCVVDALLDPRQCRLRRIANSKQRGV